MPAKIRLARHGRRKNAFYHIVVADARAPRDGKFIEKLGIYNPMTVPATIELDRNSAFDWLMKGAQPTDTARAILRFKGVYFKKHLQRGVKKGAFTQEEADSKLAEWIEAKESKITARKAQEAEAKAELRRKIAEGVPRSKPAPAIEELEAFTQDSPEEEVVAAAAVAGDAVEAKVEEVAAEATEAVEEVKAEVEAPEAEAKTEEAPKATETEETPAVQSEETPSASSEEE